MTESDYEDYRRLTDAGFDLEDSTYIKLNSGSETAKHAVAKTLCARYLDQIGYTVESEVELENQGTVDLLAYGHPERLTYVVEVETSPTRDTMLNKVEKYVKSNQAADDMLWVNVTAMPTDMLDAQEYVKTELGL